MIAVPIIFNIIAIVLGTGSLIIGSIVDPITNFANKEKINIAHEEYACKLETSNCLNSEDELCFTRSHVIPRQFHLSIDREQFKPDFTTQITANLTYSNEDLRTEISRLKEVSQENITLNTISIDGSNIFEGTKVIEFDPIQSPTNKFYKDREILKIDNQLTSEYDYQFDGVKYFQVCAEDSFFDRFSEINGSDKSWHGFKLTKKTVTRHSEIAENYEFIETERLVNKYYYFSALLLDYIDGAEQPKKLDPISTEAFDRYYEAYNKLESEGLGRSLMKFKYRDREFPLYLYPSHPENLSNLYNLIYNIYINATEIDQQSLKVFGFIKLGYRNSGKVDNWVGGNKAKFLISSYAYLRAKKENEEFFLLDTFTNTFANNGNPYSKGFPTVYLMPDTDLNTLESIAKVPSHEILETINPKAFRWCLDKVIINREDLLLTAITTPNQNPYSSNLSSSYQCKALPGGSINRIFGAKIKKLKRLR